MVFVNVVICVKVSILCCVNKFVLFVKVYFFFLIFNLNLGELRESN